MREQVSHKYWIFQREHMSCSTQWSQILTITLILKTDSKCYTRSLHSKQTCYRPNKDATQYTVKCKCCIAFKIIIKKFKMFLIITCFIKWLNIISDWWCDVKWELLLHFIIQWHRTLLFDLVFCSNQSNLPTLTLFKLKKTTRHRLDSIKVMFNGKHP